MNYFDKIKELLEECMTEKGFKLWSGINGILPDVWDKLTASTKKYHKKMDGSVPNLDEHVYEMLYAAKKLIRMFGYELKTPDADVIFFAVAMHDTLKYGKWGTRKFCDNQHDREAGDMVRYNKDTFLKLYTEEQFNNLEEAVRFHSGRWSTDVPDPSNFDLKDIGPIAYFVHILDMLSAQDLIQTDVRNTNDIISNETSTGDTALATAVNN
jgi:hypothetical protein